ncbi:MAG: hypothetical protein WA865_04220 [Spirulinaceae cyanobacterium]
MLVPLLISILLTSVAVYFSINAEEEIIQVAAAFCALLCLFLSLFFAPLAIKLLIVTVPFLGKRINYVLPRQR